MNRLVRAERSMVRAMCRVSLKDGKSSEELLSRLGIVSVVKIVEKVDCGGLGMLREKWQKIEFLNVLSWRLVVAEGGVGL